MSASLSFELPGGPYVDDTRLLSLRVDADGDITRNLAVQRLHAREALSECGAIELDCLAFDAAIEAKALLGLRAGVRLGGGRAAARWFNGIVVRVAPGEADGGRRHYRLSVQPALALLGLAQGARIHQERSVPDIIDAELRHWLARIADLQWRFELRATYPVRSYTASYAESPLAFIERLCAEEGIGYRFEHCAPERDGVGGTVVVFFDDSPSLPANPQAITEFNHGDTPEGEDAIDRWEAERRLVPGTVALNCWEYKRADLLAADAPTAHAHGQAAGLVAALEDYAPQAQYYGSGADDLERYARLRIEAHEARAKIFRGEGTVRRFVPGTCTELVGHFEAGAPGPEADRTYLLLSVEHEAVNNLPAELGAVGAEAGYRNRFTAIRHAIPWRPEFTRERHAKPRVPGLQTARVVGRDGGEVDVDEYGRVLVRFHWDREQRSSCRLRVANAVSGSGWGMQTLPRIGQEVLVDYLEGDIDRPMIVGAVHNGQHMPPQFSGVGSLPANAALCGIQTREFGGGRGFGELLFDDTGGQLRTKLSSEHAATQLNQGWLGTPRTEGDSRARGEGFELRTDAAGALRGGQGLLLSAFARLRASGSQLSRDETAGLMDECLQLFRALGDYAAGHHGGATETAAHVRLKDDFAQWENGSNTAAEARPPGGAGLVAVTAPQGVHLSSPQSVITHAGRTVDTVALQHLQFASGERTTLNAGQGMSLFAQSGGMKLIAHQGPLALQSHNDDTRIESARDLKLFASDGRLHGMAADEILLSVAGGAYIKLSGGDVEIGAPGTVRVRAASHDWSGPASSPAELPAFGKSELGRTPRLVRATDGAPVGGYRYEIRRADGSTASGTTDAAGRGTEVTSGRFERLLASFTSPDQP